MKSLAEQMSIYQRYHTKFFTRIANYIGVPLVIFATLILLSWFHAGITGLFTVSVSWLAVIVLLVYYFLLDWQLAIVMTIIYAIVTWIATVLSWPSPSWLSFKIFLIAFILGWGFILAGYFIERQKPALMNIYQIFIAPIFFLAKICFRFGKKQALKDKIES